MRQQLPHKFTPTSFDEVMTLLFIQNSLSAGYRRLRSRTNHPIVLRCLSLDLYNRVCYQNYGKQWQHRYHSGTTLGDVLALRRIDLECQSWKEQELDEGSSIWNMMEDCFESFLTQSEDMQFDSYGLIDRKGIGQNKYYHFQSKKEYS